MPEMNDGIRRCCVDHFSQGLSSHFDWKPRNDLRSFRQGGSFANYTRESIYPLSSR